MIEDRFLYFTYNGISSKDFDVFYTNNGEDIIFPFSPSIRQETTSPLYQQRSLWLGASKEAKKFSLELAAERRTIDDIEDIYRWLELNTPGKLMLDFRGNYEYDVVISNIEDPIIVPYEMDNGEIKSVVRFKVEFESIGDHRPKAAIPFTVMTGGAEKSEYHEPDSLLLALEVSGNTVKVINWEGEPQSLIFQTTANQQTITIGKKAYKYLISEQAYVRVDTEIGALLNIEGRPLQSVYPKAEIKSPGPVEIDSMSIVNRDLSFIVNGNETHIKLPEVLEDREYRVAVASNKKYKKKYIKAGPVYPYTGLYDIIERGDGFELVVPEVGVGTKTTDGIKVNTNFGYSDGVYKARVKIASVGVVTLTRESALEFRYKKEV